MYVNYQPGVLESQIYIKGNTFPTLSNAYAIAQTIIAIAKSYNIWEVSINASEDFVSGLRTILKNSTDKEIKIEVN
jgi:hypothetical protein